MGEKVTSDELCPDSLFDLSLRLVATNIEKIHPHNLQCLPNYIKRRILKYATGHLFPRRKQAFENEEIIKALLNSEVTNLELIHSITTDYTLHSISEKCALLRELTLGAPHCTAKRITLQTFIPKMKYLTVLCLQELDNVTDESISGLSELEHLKHLNLRKCTQLTDNCGNILRNLKLEKLDMSYTNITSNWMQLLEGSTLNEHLTDVNLSFCRALANDSLNSLNWSKLKYVGLLGLSDLEFMDNLGKLKFVQWTVPF